MTDVSIVITTRDEETSIYSCLTSLLRQSLPAEEIIVVDSCSTDKTCQEVSLLQEKYPLITLIRKDRISRSEGRNIGIKVAKNKLIVLTDAGCIANRNWLREITKPFSDKKVQVAAGFYKMRGDTPFQKALTPFLGITPEKYNNNFLPSARSMAFRRGAWSRVGGFPEHVNGAGEDTLFNVNLLKARIKIHQAPKAIVYWDLPSSLPEAFRKFYNY